MRGGSCRLCCRGRSSAASVWLAFRHSFTRLLPPLHILPRGLRRHDDATRDDRLSFTHIYVFDRVFSKRTLIALAQVLTRSPFLVFVSFRPCHEWWRYGLVKVQPVAKLNCRTTGKEGCNAYVYINLERAPGFKAPKDCCGDD